MQSRLHVLESELDKLTTEIIVPLRIKNINEDAFDRLFRLLEEMVILVSSELTISRKVVGLLFYIFTQLEIQSKYSNEVQTKELQIKRTKLHGLLRQLFGSITEN